MDRKRPYGNARFFSLPGVLFLALFFLGGVILGQVLAGKVPGTTGEELERYLTDFVTLDDTARSSGAIWSMLVLYFRYPLLGFLLGFASIGVVLLPCVTAAFGFSMSFSVCCFTAAFGVDGVLLALAVFGLRCAVTLPCYFLLAAASWRSSAALAALSLGRGRRVAPVTYGSQHWLRVGVVAVALLAGVCVDWLCSPWLLELALGRFLIG